MYDIYDESLHISWASLDTYICTFFIKRYVVKAERLSEADL